MGDARILRLRQSDRADDVGRVFADNPDPRPWFGRVIDGGSIPTGPDKYYLVAPASLSDPECEGCTGGEALDTSLAVPVAIVRGSPVAGDPVIVRSSGGRWVGEKRGGGGGGSGCICPGLPGTLHWTYTSKAGGTTIGVTTGTLSYSPDIEAAMGRCFEDMGSGYVGEFSFWSTYLKVPPPGEDGGSGTYLETACFDPATDYPPDAQPVPGACERCTWLALLCSPEGFGGPAYQLWRVQRQPTSEPCSPCNLGALQGFPYIGGLGSCSPFVWISTLTVGFFAGSQLVITA